MKLAWKKNKSEFENSTMSWDETSEEEELEGA